MLDNLWYEFYACEYANKWEKFMRIIFGSYFYSVVNLYLIFPSLLVHMYMLVCFLITQSVSRIIEQFLIYIIGGHVPFTKRQNRLIIKYIVYSSTNLVVMLCFN